MNDRYKHLKILKMPESEHYSSPRPYHGFKNPKRDRSNHGALIKKHLYLAFADSEKEITEYKLTRDGFYLEFASSPGFELDLKNLEDIAEGIRLCNVRYKSDKSKQEKSKNNNITYASVFIPKSKQSHFFSKIDEYLTRNTRYGNPKNHKLIESINNVKQAMNIDSFWTDASKLKPQTEKEWCEIWLKSDDDDVRNNFEKMLVKNKIQFKKGFLKFPERTVIVVLVSKNELELITRNSSDIAEYRKAKSTTAFFLNEPPSEQALWVNDLVRRIKAKTESNVSICLLDTGVNNSHPLISPFLKEEDCHAVNSEWQIHDHAGHGTLMAGIAIYGDISECIESTNDVIINHLIESNKIFPPNGSNDPKLWGKVTCDAILNVIKYNSKRARIYCMATTSHENLDRGRPSSWSAAIDQITSGYDNSIRKLVILAAGNCSEMYTDINQLANYPNAQITNPVQDPAQSWNSLSVGAYTQLANITDPTFIDYIPVAKENQLSPFSTTSHLWEQKKWPIKPDVVFEGGNVAVDSCSKVSVCDDLSLISTNFEPQQRLLGSMSMTSAAAAQAANFAARVQAMYPEYWAETVRGLIVHSAEWPEELKNQFAINDNKKELSKVLRSCGYGVPNLDAAISCALNSVTLIAETEIQPYEKFGSNVRAKDMHIYELPWPKEVLENNPDMEMKMRVTLSYFIEPGPGEIGWKQGYSYSSHAFRFELISPGERVDDFKKRINRAARADKNDKSETVSQAKRWRLGTSRNKGSIHSDTWTGNAQDLASSNLIAIYPIVGWWRERDHLKKYNNKTRYSLIISINTPELEETIDLYNPIRNELEIPISNPISLQ